VSETPTQTDSESEVATAAFVEITLKYDGRGVDDGSMPVEDVISALRGLSGAYSKIAAVFDPNARHEIRVSAVNRSSFLVGFLAWAKANAGALKTLDAVKWIVSTILKLIEFKKANKGQSVPQPVFIQGNGNLVFNIGDNAQMILPKEVFELLKGKTVDSDLGKIVGPLREGEVEAVTLAAKVGAKEIAPPMTVTSSEKEFFRSDSDSPGATSNQTEVVGHFVSLNKESNRGLFKMQSGSKVQFHLTGDTADSMHQYFAHGGSLRAECVAHFDGNLELRSIDINRVTPVPPLQSSLFEAPPSGPDQAATAS